MVDEYGLETVQDYMYHIRDNAELSVRNLLKDVAKRMGKSTLHAIDYLDDGSPVCTLDKFTTEFILRHIFDIRSN